MSYQINLAPSKIVRLAKGDDTGENKDTLQGLKPTRATKEERALKKEIELGQKDGTIPALQDEAGKDINPHNPLFIMQVPWYYDAAKPTLKVFLKSKYHFQISSNLLRLRILRINVAGDPYLAFGPKSSPF